MIRQRTSSAILPLLVLAVLLRSLVADGYMPGRDGTVMLCTSQGMVMVPAEPGGGPVPPDADTTVMLECPWASVFFTLMLAPVEASLPAHRPAQAPPDTLASSRSTTSRTGIPPARAPPAAHA